MDTPIASAKRTRATISTPASSRKQKAAAEEGNEKSRKSAKTSSLFSPKLAATDSEEVEEEVPADEEEEEEDEVFNPYLFISGLPSHENVTRNSVFLPPPAGSSSSSYSSSSSSSTSTNNRPTLVLDLDETLVHCGIEPIERPDLTFPVSFNDSSYTVYVKKRPYLDYFLEQVSRSFEVVVFTASQKVYADVLLDLLDPEKKIEHRLFREACLLVHGNYVKDLSVLGRDLQRTVLVDNSPHAYSYHVENGIPIESYYDQEKDTELLKLAGFLRRVAAADDVRPLIRDHFKSYALVEDARQGLPVSLLAPPF